MLRIYQCIIQPRLDCAITLWGFTSQLNVSRVQRLQLLTINGRGIDIVKLLKWINVIERRDYLINVFVAWHLPIFLIALLSATMLL